MTTLATMLTDLRTRLRDANGVYITDALGTQYLNEASRQWARMTNSVTKIKGMLVLSNKQTYTMPRGLLKPLWCWDTRTPRRIFAVSRTKPAEPWLPVWHIVSSGLTWWFYIDNGNIVFLPRPNYDEPFVDFVGTIAASDVTLTLTASAVDFPRRGRLLIVDSTVISDPAITQSGGAIYPVGTLANKVEEIYYENMVDNGNGTLTFSRIFRGSGDTKPLAFTNPRIFRLSIEMHYIGLPAALAATTDTTDISDNDLEAVYTYAAYLAAVHLGKPNDAEGWRELYAEFVAQKRKEQRVNKGDMQNRLNWADDTQEFRTVI